MTTLIHSDRTRVRTWMERLTLGRAIRTIVFVATLMVIAGGVLVRVVEPDTFTSIGLSFWWAVDHRDHRRLRRHGARSAPPAGSSAPR